MLFTVEFCRKERKAKGKGERGEEEEVGEEEVEEDGKGLRERYKEWGTQ